MSTATISLKLTQAQQRDVVRLFKSNVTKYTEIAKQLGLPYVAVNKFMTKWKRKHGLLKSRNEAEKTVIKRKEQAPVISKSTASVSASELAFLRNYYLKSISQN